MDAFHHQLFHPDLSGRWKVGIELVQWAFERSGILRNRTESLRKEDVCLKVDLPCELLDGGSLCQFQRMFLKLCAVAAF